MFEFLETIRLKRELKNSQMRADLAQYSMLEKTFSDAQKFVQPEPDEGNWIKMSDAGNMMEIGQTGYDHYEMLRKAFAFWATDLYARAIIRNLTKFVLGKGPIIKSHSENKIVEEEWKNFAKANKWGKREKEMVNRAFRDGEVFLRFFEDESTGILRARFMRAENIRNPSLITTSLLNTSFGIETDPDDVENVLFYYLCDAQGKLNAKVDAKEVMHIKILTDSDVKRGMSMLLIAMKMLKKYEGWMDDRIVLNKVRSAIALIRKVPGTAGAVDNIRGKHQSEIYSSDRYKQKAFNSGTVITASKGIEYEMLSPNIQAADAKDDGRNMLLAVAAGMGLPEMILTSDYSNSNYASSLTAQNPFVREIEDWQDFFQDTYQEIFARVVAFGKKFGKIPKGESEECDVIWPPMILADILKSNQAREIQHRNKIISKKTWQMKDELNPATEEQNMVDEQGKAVYRQPFNMPSAPVNQFGSFGDEEE